MLQVSVARLFEDNRSALSLAWAAGEESGSALIQRDNADSSALIGHLNLLHPNRVQVFGGNEISHLTGLEHAAAQALIERMLAAKPALIAFCDGQSPPELILESAASYGLAVLVSPLPGAQVINTLRRYLAKVLAESTERHGVCMDVLGLGVLITGDSGVGKSELALELISRGHGLVADDVVEITRMPPNRLECRCPPMLKDFLEVRGLGVLNIRTIFGETAVRPKMNLRLVVHLEKPTATGTTSVERLPLHELSEDILGTTVRKVVIPVAAGRNLAVLLEAAVRNYILQLRGIFSTREFIERQQAELGKSSES